MKGLNTVKWLSLIAGILLIVTGIIYITKPLESTVSLVTVIASSLIVLGIIRVIRYLSGSIFSTGSFLVGGILDTILGIIMLMNIESSTVAFVLLIGFWVLLNGIIQIAISLDVKKLGIDYWWFDLLSGILGIILGIMLIGDFGLSTLYISIMIGGYMLLLGIAFIVAFFSINKFMRNYNNYINFK